MVTQGAAGTDRPQHRWVAGQRCWEGVRQTWALMRPEEEEKAAAIPLSGGQTPHHSLDGTDPHPSTPRHCRPQFLLPFVPGTLLFSPQPWVQQWVQQGGSHPAQPNPRGGPCAPSPGRVNRPGAPLWRNAMSGLGLAPAIALSCVWHNPSPAGTAPGVGGLGGAWGGGVVLSAPV